VCSGAGGGPRRSADPLPFPLPVGPDPRASPLPARSPPPAHHRTHHESDRPRRIHGHAARVAEAGPGAVPVRSPRRPGAAPRESSRGRCRPGPGGAGRGSGCPPAGRTGWVGGGGGCGGGYSGEGARRKGAGWETVHAGMRGAQPSCGRGARTLTTSAKIPLLSTATPAGHQTEPRKRVRPHSPDTPGVPAIVDTSPDDNISLLITLLLLSACDKDAL